MLSFRRVLERKRLVLVLCVGFTALTFQPDHRVSAQDLPVVSLTSVQPSPVREGSGLTATVRIAPPVPAGSNETIRGGIWVFDSWKGKQVDQLIAFVFRAGQVTKSMTYGVDDDGQVTTDRTIRVEVNRLFEGYRVGAPSTTTVRVLDKDTTWSRPSPHGYAEADAYVHARSNPNPYGYPGASSHCDTQSYANSPVPGQPGHLRRR